MLEADRPRPLVPLTVTIGASHGDHWTVRGTTKDTPRRASLRTPLLLLCMSTSSPMTALDPGRCSRHGAPSAGATGRLAGEPFESLVMSPSSNLLEQKLALSPGQPGTSQQVS